MRIRAQDILEMLGGGMTQAEILADFDELGAEDIAAALAYAAQAVSHSVIKLAAECERTSNLGCLAGCCAA